MRTDASKPTFKDDARSNQPGKLRALCVQALLAAAVWLCPLGTAQAQTDLLSLRNSRQQPCAQYSFTRAAADTATWLTTFFRPYPGCWGLDDISFTPVSSSGTELAANGGLETGDFTGWTITGQPGLHAAVGVAPGTPGTTTGDSHSSSFFYSDGAAGGVEGVAQSFATAIGEDYNLSFRLSDDGGETSSLDNHAGTQDSSYLPILYDWTPPIDGGPFGVPEPSSFALIVLGFGAFGLVCWARSRPLKWPREPNGQPSALPGSGGLFPTRRES